jgi:DNA-binding response OmpR family regulator
MRVLLVDDEPELVFTMQERLDLRGYEVDAVTSGEEALGLVARNAYDVVVVDVKMPGMSGGEVMIEIRELRPGLPVILLTGHGGHEEGEEHLLRASCAYLFKPINIEELIATMKRCTGEESGDDA